MEIEIKALLSDQGRIIGLGADNKLYRWNFSSGTWLANWDTRSAEEKDSLKHSIDADLTPHTPGTNA
jgi:hypothetical protein